MRTLHVTQRMSICTSDVSSCSPQKPLNICKEIVHSTKHLWQVDANITRHATHVNLHVARVKLFSSETLKKIREWFIL